MKPLPLNGDEKVDTIELQWNVQYEKMKEFYSKNSATKEEFLNILGPILSSTLRYANSAIDLFKKYKNKTLSEDIFVQEMQKMKPQIDELYKKAGNIPFPPDDCKDYDNTFQGLIGTVHNMSLFYENDGLKRWPQHNRDWLMSDTINRYLKEIQKLSFEQDKIHSS